MISDRGHTAASWVWLAAECPHLFCSVILRSETTEESLKILRFAQDDSREKARMTVEKAQDDKKKPSGHIGGRHKMRVFMTDKRNIFTDIPSNVISKLNITST